MYVLRPKRLLYKPVSLLTNNVGCKLTYLNRVVFLKSFNFSLGSTALLDPILLGRVCLLIFIYDHFRTIRIECLIRKEGILFSLEVVLG